MAPQLRSALARWLRRAAGLTLRAASALDAADPPARAGGPPGHWLSVVSAGAPQLLTGGGIGTGRRAGMPGSKPLGPAVPADPSSGGDADRTEAARVSSSVGAGAEDKAGAGRRPGIWRRRESRSGWGSVGLPDATRSGVGRPAGLRPPSSTPPAAALTTPTPDRPRRTGDRMPGRTPARSTKWRPWPRVGRNHTRSTNSPTEHAASRVPAPIPGASFDTETRVPKPQPPFARRRTRSTAVTLPPQWSPSTTGDKASAPDASGPEASGPEASRTEASGTDHGARLTGRQKVAARHSDPWPPLPDDTELWTVTPPVPDERLRRLDDEQAGR